MVRSVWQAATPLPDAAALASRRWLLPQFGLDVVVDKNVITVEIIRNTR